VIEFNPIWVDVTQHLASGEQPLILLPRDKSSTFYTLTSGAFEEPKWSMCRTGDFVRVPMHAYRTASHARGAVFGLGVQLGILAESLRHAHGIVATLANVLLGSQCTDLRPNFDAYRCYLGISFRI
jgi:hypothetical protein